MKNHSLLLISVAASALLFCASGAYAADAKAPAEAPKASAPGHEHVSKADIAAKRKAAAAIKLVDINSAKRDELKTLPGIGDAEADKIIAGRPYATKAHLISKNVIPDGVYAGIRQQVIAKQPFADAAKNAALYDKKK